MRRVRVGLAAMMVAAAIGWLYLAIMDGRGHDALRRVLWIAMAAGWIGFALVAWRERRRHV